MKNLINARRILALVGALLLGAFGSGIWDVLLKPFFVWVGGGLLNIATLGIQSLIDNIYFEVAKGSYERAADAAYQALMLIFGLGALGFGVVVFLAFREVGKKDSSPTTQDPESRRQRRRTVIFSALVMQSIGLGAIIINTSRLSYIIRASNYLEQCERIIAPKISSEQRIEIASRIAQIRSRDDFLNRLDELQTLAKTNNLYLPAFSVF